MSPIDELAARAVDLPMPVSLAAYGNAQRRFIEQAERLVPAVTVLALGGFSCPGISDIDLMCVVPRDTARTKLEGLCALTRADPLFVHGPFIVPDDLSADIRWLMPNIRYTRLAGSDAGHEATLPRDALYDAAMTHLADALVEQAIWFFRLDWRAALPVRRLILRLSGLRYQISLAEELAVTLPPAARALAASVTAMRDRWNETEKVDLEALWEITRSADEIALAASHLVAAAAMRHIPMRAAFGRAREIKLGRAILSGADGPGGIVSRHAGSLSRRRRYFEIPSSPELFEMYALALNTSASLDPERAALRARFTVVRRWTAFLERRQLYGACLPPTLLGLKDPRRAGRLVDALVARRLIGLKRSP